MSQGPQQGTRTDFTTASAWSWRAMLLLLSMALLAHGFWQEHHLTGGEWGAPLDDTYIHLQYARQLAGGHGLAFNTGDYTPGVTCPLWTLTLAGLCAVGLGGVLWATVCSAALFVVLVQTAFAVGRQAFDKSRWAAALAAAVALSGRLNWAALSGMEPILSSLLVLVALWLILRSRQPIGRLCAAGVLATSALARPEVAVLFAVFWMLQVVQTVRTRREPKAGRYTLLAGQLLLFATIVGSYVIYCLWAYGHPLPATYYAKQQHPNWLPNLHFVKLYLGHLFLDQPMLMWLAPIGVLWVLWRPRQPGLGVLAAWVLAYPLIAALNQPNAGQHGRYAMFMIAPHLLLAALAVTALGAKANRSQVVAAVRSGYWVVALLVGLGLTLHWQLRSAEDVHEINRMQVHLGRWIKANTAPDALIAANDVGAIGYFGCRRIIDTCGLVTTEQAPFRRQLRLPMPMQKELLDYLTRRRPDYAVLFPAWYPWMVGQSAIFEPVYAVRLPRARIADQSTMVVYRCRWSADEPADH
jgi:arabinofuranosyltransferase